MSASPLQIPKKAYLLLADGTFFEGEAIGKIGTVGGEVCFNTGMTGYQEIYTDPSYYGQIVVNTNVHIGNYGTMPPEAESNGLKIKGLVVKAFSPTHSRSQADASLQDYLEKANVVGISNIDTRMLVSHIRNKGAMNAVISSELHRVEELKAALAEVPNMDGLELASAVSTPEPYFFGNPQAPLRLAVLDVGIKTNILRNFADRGCFCQVFPAQTTFEEMEAWQPHGYFISNGPGDPAPMQYAVEAIRKVLAADKPLFGICLGHQLLALACGLPTYKMHHGHRGLNHPVKNLISGRCEITSQNHGFGVVPEAVKASDKVEVTHINLNDDTVEGIRVKGKKAFSVQYHPEAAPGPHDSRYLFDEFVALMQA
jgi:carbamoyl-phosphate synthase small subunit